MPERLERKDIRFLLACLVVAAACIAVGATLFYKVFPEAAIDFKLTREQSRDEAAAFLKTRGFSATGFRHSAVFEFDGLAKTFLERELGLEGATRLIRERLRLWRWENRWVKELQKEEFRVEIATAGGLAGFSHFLEEDAAGASLTEAEARRLAEEFLRDALQKDLAGLVFVEGKALVRKHRTDYAFTWKASDLDVKGATYRFKVDILGNCVGGYREFLKVPEAWQRDYRKLRSRNELTGQAASVLAFLLFIGMVGVVALRTRRRDVRWKTALAFGGIAFALTLLGQLNALPLQEHYYSTTETFGSFLTGQLWGALLSALGAGLVILFLTAAAEPLYRECQGSEISLGRQFLISGIRTKRFLLLSVLGLSLAAFFFAYQVLFYLAAEKLGAWCPADIPYSDMLNTRFPWIYVLLIGFMPAVSEEFVFRIFGIHFLAKLFKRLWPAVIVSAFIWGFAHSNYPNQPFYIRGVEVGLAGVIVGIVLLKYGILPCLVWHYTVDALYTALILLRSSNSYFVVSAAISCGILLLPLLLAAGLYLRRREFADPEPLLNRNEQPPAPLSETPVAAEPSAPWSYLPLSRSRRLVLLAIGLLALILFFVKVEKPGDFIRHTIGRTEAENLARAHLKTQGRDLSGYRAAVSFSSNADPSALKYLMEHGGVARVNRMYSRDLCPAVWRVRFFDPLQKEEYTVALDSSGCVYSVQHLLDEDAAGADLAGDEARRIAEAQMEANGLSAGDFTLMESSSEKLKNRRDHSFTFEAKDGDPRHTGEARYRCRVTVAGNQASGLFRFLKIPEQWLRDRNKSTTLKSALRGLLAVLQFAVIIHLIVLFFLKLRRQSVPWKTGLLFALLLPVLQAAMWLNDLPSFYEYYRTDMPVESFIAQQIMGFAVSLIGMTLAAAACFAFVFLFYPQTLEALAERNRAVQVKDALPMAAAFALLLFALTRLHDTLALVFPAAVLQPRVESLSGLDSCFPALTSLCQAVQNGLWVAFALAAAIYYALHILRRPVFIGLALTAIVLIYAGSETHALNEAALMLLVLPLNGGVILLFIVFFFRNNIYAYFLGPFLAALAEQAAPLLCQPKTAFQVQGWILVAAGLAVCLAFWRWGKSTKNIRLFS